MNIFLHCNLYCTDDTDIYLTLVMHHGQECHEESVEISEKCLENGYSEIIRVNSFVR